MNVGRRVCLKGLIGLILFVMSIQTIRWGHKKWPVQQTGVKSNMAIDRHQLLQYVIIPILDRLGVGGRDATCLMMVTGEIESGYKYINQLNNGPAKGFWQIEPTTHIDLWENFLRFNPKLASQISHITGIHPSKENHNALVWNLAYSLCMARMVYYRQDFHLPNFEDVTGMWNIYKTFYNSREGKSNFTQFVSAHHTTLPYIRYFYPS